MLITVAKFFFNSLLSSICIIIVLGLVVLARAAPRDALVTFLPGFNGTFLSKHYSGYVAVGDKPSQNLFYYLVESERKTSKDPVVLWLNGGPGCSSMDGFVYEHGPFNFKPGKTHGSLPTWHLNEYSWSKVSNIIYLDSPVGVGFSYTKYAGAYASSDLGTAYYTLQIRFIAGESYAGIFVPTLASEIVKGMARNGSGVKPNINLKGYMVGNGVTDENFDGNALIPFAHGMGLISDKIFEEVEAACGGNYYNSPSERCKTMLSKVDEVLGGLNVYDILEPCFHNPYVKNDGHGNNYSSLPISFRQLGITERPLAVRKRMFGRAWPFRAPVRDGIVTPWPKLISNHEVPCIDDRVASTWLNDRNVRKAIHAVPVTEIGQWEICCDKLIFVHDAGSMIPYHKNLTASGFRVLIFSGDHEMCVPYTGSQAWTRSLGYKIVDEWRPWRSLTDQVAGYVQEYSNDLTFLTIKGARHTVPEYKPREALEFCSRWLERRPV